jgi:hypothetical protein
MTTARHARLFRLAVTALFVLASACSGSDGSKGSRSGSIKLRGTFSSQSAALTAVSSFDPSAIRTVVVFDSTGAFSTAPVTNGSFSVDAMVTRPAGVIFAGSAREFLGALSLGTGIGALPLSKAESGVSTIDLQTLTSSGTLFLPSHNPIGVELPLTASEQTAFAQANGFFAATVQNPDVDGNGIVDVLEGKFFHVFVGYSVNGVKFGGALTPDLPGGVSIGYFNLSIQTEGTGDAGPVTVTGPAGSGLDGTPAYAFVAGSQTYYNTYVNLGSSPTPVPLPGTYVFTTGQGRTLTFVVPDQSQANARIVVALPTVSLNPNGTIHEISWTYRTGSDAAALDPEALISSIGVQVDRPLGSRIYDSPNLPASTRSHVLANQGISWDASTHLAIGYNDVFGNHYVMGFSNAP